MLSNKYLAYTVLGLLILVIAYNIKYFSSKQTPQNKSAEFVSGTAAFPLTPTNAERHIIRKDNASWRDPFALEKADKIKKKASKAEIRLIGILNREGDKSHALINGKIYGINDAVDGSVIIDIKKESVVISTEGKEEEIYLSLTKETKNE
jgi:type II secretory pathway component PulC